MKLTTHHQQLTLRISGVNISAPPLCLHGVDGGNFTSYIPQRNRIGGRELNLSGLGQGQVLVSGERGSQPSGSIK